MATIQLYLLGTPCLEGSGRAVPLDRQKTIALLAYLAVNQQPCSRAELTALLWPESPAEKAQNALRCTLAGLRKVIGRDILQATRTTISLTSFVVGGLPPSNGDESPTTNLWVDVHTFRQLLAQNTPEALAEALNLYRGDFLSGFTLRDSPQFDEWQSEQTRQCREEAAQACESLSHHYANRQEWHTAVQYTQRWLALDPLHEAAHRCLMSLYEQQGNRSAALCQYLACTRLLADELDVEPEAATTELYLRLRDGRSPHPMSPSSLTFAPPPLCSPALHPQAITLMKTAVNKAREGDLAGAEACYHQALALARESGDGGTAAQLSNNLALLYQHQGKEAADYLPLFFESLDAFKKLNDQHGLRLVLLNIGHACLQLEEYDDAQQALAETLRLGYDERDDYFIGMMFYLSGKVACQQGHHGAAIGEYEDALEILADMDAPQLVQRIWQDIENCLAHEPALSGRLKNPLNRLRYRYTAATPADDDSDLSLYFECGGRNGGVDGRIPFIHNSQFSPPFVPYFNPLFLLRTRWKRGKKNGARLKTGPNDSRRPCLSREARSRKGICPMPL